MHPIPGFAQPVSSFTHLLGAATCLALAPRLFRRGAGKVGPAAVLVVYALSCVLLFSASAAFHALPPGGSARAVAERLDHAAIFVLIAGTFTPIHGLLFRGTARWGVLFLVWSAAAGGAALKATLLPRIPEAVGLASYLGLGWAGALSAAGLTRRYGPRFTWPLLAGGTAYTAGAAADFFHWGHLAPGVFGPHEVLHIAVLVGVALHWQFVSRCCQPPERRKQQSVMVGERGRMCLMPIAAPGSSDII